MGDGGCMAITKAGGRWGGPWKGAGGLTLHVGLPSVEEPDAEGFIRRGAIGYGCIKPAKSGRGNNYRNGGTAGTNGYDLRKERSQRPKSEAKTELAGRQLSCPHPPKVNQNVGEKIGPLEHTGR